MYSISQKTHLASCFNGARQHTPACHLRAQHHVCKTVKAHAAASSHGYRPQDGNSSSIAARSNGADMESATGDEGEPGPERLMTGFDDMGSNFSIKGNATGAGAASAGVDELVDTKLMLSEPLLHELFGPAADGAGDSFQHAFSGMLELEHPQQQALLRICLGLDGYPAAEPDPATATWDRAALLPASFVAAAAAAAEHMRTSTYTTSLPHDAKLSSMLCMNARCPISHCMSEADVLAMPRQQLPALYVAVVLSCWCHAAMWWARGGTFKFCLGEEVHVGRWAECAQVSKPIKWEEGSARFASHSFLVVQT